MKRPLASVVEVAEYLDVPVQSVYSWRQRGLGPKSSKVGRHVRYRWDDVEKWLDDQATAAV